MTNTEYLWSQRSLYTSISSPAGIKAVEIIFGVLSKKNSGYKNNLYIHTFLSLILTFDNFVFNCENYLQMKGGSMRTI